MRASTAKYRLYHLLWSGLDLVLPPVCAGCGVPGVRWCPDCQCGVAVLPEPLCKICGTPIDGSLHLCPECSDARPCYEQLRSWSAFAGPVREALLRIKYRRDVGVGEALTPQLANFVWGNHVRVDVLVPVPLGKRRLRERGYNQVAVIARPLALALGLAYKADALARTRETRSQVGLTKSDRRDNVQGAFEAKRRVVEGRTILLMDDVATTGSTLSSCAEALHAAGAQDVFAVTVARALPAHPSSRT